jgi:hypothetical protein
MLPQAMLKYDQSLQTTPAEPAPGMVKMQLLSEGVFLIRWACTPEHPHNSKGRLGVVCPDKDALSVHCDCTATGAEKTKTITKTLRLFML